MSDEVKPGCCAATLNPEPWRGVPLTQDLDRDALDAAVNAYNRDQRSGASVVGGVEAAVREAAGSEQVCRACGGSGHRNGSLRAADPFGTCPGCGGTGNVAAADREAPDEEQRCECDVPYYTCPRCQAKIDAGEVVPWPDDPDDEIARYWASHDQNDDPPTR